MKREEERKHERNDEKTQRENDGTPRARDFSKKGQHSPPLDDDDESDEMQTALDLGGPAPKFKMSEKKTRCELKTRLDIGGLPHFPYNVPGEAKSARTRQKFRLKNTERARRAPAVAYFCLSGLSAVEAQRPAEKMAPRPKTAPYVAFLCCVFFYRRAHL